MTNEAEQIPSRYRPLRRPPLVSKLGIRLFMNDEDKLRRERGMREFSRVRKSDAVLFSPGNSGRTWLRVMLTHLLEAEYGVADLPTISYNNAHKVDSRILKLTVTHNRWLPYYKLPRPGRECAAYYDSRVLALVRNPLDTCISQYYQWRHRSNDKNVQLKGWPSRDDDLSLQAFLADERTGILRLCQELNIWLRELPKFRHGEFIRYEDLRADPAGGLSMVARFLQIPYSPGSICKAVEFAEFSNMQKREANKNSDSPERHNYRVSIEDNNGLKARQGTIAGYRKTLDEDESASYEDIIRRNLDAAFGYNQLPSICDATLPIGHRS